ncbi:ABC transporter substrate-binding protein [Halobaculum sp. MBLA0143]|uniref:ABC transporter substrate-binding protein n=1 Tax=Halobaculum sp. MBLA0143 TaxID=3079933 RepID=UPI0035254664
MTDEITRRRYLKGAAGVGATLAAAGCASGGGDGASNELEVLHAWTGGDGKKAVENLISVWNEQHSDVASNFKAIGGGANQNLKSVLNTRFSNDDPPSAFQDWPGKNFARYEGVLGDISSVWEGDDGLAEAHVEEAAELCRQDGTYHAVPIGSHRLNCLFYNVSVLEDAGVDPDSLDSASKLMDAMDTVASETDAVPLAHGMKAPWTTLQLWAAVMLSTGGVDSYMDFVNNGGSKGAVREAFSVTKTMLDEYIENGAASTGFTGANQMIMDGDAAFIHQGNWAAGAFRNREDFAYDEDWGFKTFPGTEGMYTFHTDAFLYPSNNPSPEASETWMRFVGSKDAQVAFNKFKGSIPTRTDVDESEFGPYLQETIQDFAEANEKPPTLAHGLAAQPEQVSSLKSALTSDFTGPYNVDSATESFVSTLQS